MLTFVLLSNPKNETAWYYLNEKTQERNEGKLLKKTMVLVSFHHQPQRFVTGLLKQRFMATVYRDLYYVFF